MQSAKERFALRRYQHIYRAILFLVASAMSPQCSALFPVMSVQPRLYQIQKSAADLAKVLAVDLNTNETLRKEVFSKIANRFDGDRDILPSHLTDASIAEVQQLAKSSSLKSKLAKGGASYQEVDMQSLTMKSPKLQIMMPYLEQWTDAKIEQAGGLVVACYPIGFDDRKAKVKEITGYDKNGNEIKITKETAPKISYVILSENERTNEDGNLKHDSKAQSLQGGNPKYFDISNRGDWKAVALNELQTVKVPENNSAATSGDFFKTLKSDAAMTSYSEGGGNPPPQPSPPTKMYVSNFLCNNVSDYEEYWVKGEPEFFIKIYLAGFSGQVAGFDVNFSAYTFKLLNPSYEGHDVIHFFWVEHVYRNDWASAGDPAPRSWSDATYLNLAGFGNPSGIPLICPPFQVYVYEDDVLWNDYVGDSYFNYTDTFPKDVWVTGSTAIKVQSVP